VLHGFCGVLMMMIVTVKTKFTVLIMVFWVVMPCDLVGSYHCYGGTYCLHLHPKDCGDAFL
jgi:hypothetical protein